MSILQELDSDQIDEALAAAVERRVPATVTVRTANGWTNLHSRILQVRDHRAYIDMPKSDSGETSPQFTPAQKIGISFKLKHYKHLFTGTVIDSEALALDGGAHRAVLAMCVPGRMQRLQRRAYIRAEVPENRIVRMSFWLGGREAEPAGATADKPVWFGRVTNISAGGMQVLTDAEPSGALDVGDSVGVRIAFGTGSEEAVFADAQFRHAEPAGSNVIMGFQLVGLGITPESRRALELVTSHVSEYQRAELHHVGQGFRD